MDKKLDGNKLDLDLFSCFSYLLDLHILCQLPHERQVDIIIVAL